MGVRVITGWAIAAAAVTACSRPPPQALAYYRAHPAERATRLAACRRDRSRLAATANCVNALEADGEDASRRFWSNPKPASRVRTPGTL